MWKGREMNNEEYDMKMQRMIEPCKSERKQIIG